MEYKVQKSSNRGPVPNFSLDTDKLTNLVFLSIPILSIYLLCLKRVLYVIENHFLKIM